jgi:hypothetical protein
VNTVSIRKWGAAAEVQAGYWWRACATVARRVRPAGAFVAGRLRSAWARRGVRIATLALFLAVCRRGLVSLFDETPPDIEPFIRLIRPRRRSTFQGKVLIELHGVAGWSLRRVPVILRQAILATEDKNFFSHSGVDYTALPRVVQKTAVRSVATWWKGEGFRLRLAQGGSTLTQQLVRGYFLRDRTSREDGTTLFRRGVAP